MPPSSGSNRLRACAPLLLPALAALVAYFGVHEFGFVFDDENAIVANEALRAGDWWSAAFGAYNSLSNRPLACLSLSIDLRMGLSPGGMHVVSLMIHLANAVLVGVIARAILGGSALVPSLAAAAWAVHPLGVDAVAYLTQRSMLLMGFFVLIAVAALLRSNVSPHRRRWRAVVVMATALAFASKEECVALPILLVLADRAFCAESWKALRQRLGFYLALASTWIVLFAMVSLGPDNPTVGYSTTPPATAWEWLLTQTQCLTHYVVSVFWPGDLRGMYDFGVIREVGPAVIPGLLVLAGIAGTIYAFRRWPRLGMAGAWFFLLLAPTSSVLPIITEPCADRRMYLPLLAFVLPFAAFARTGLGNGATVAIGGIVVALLVGRTRELARTYRDDLAFMTHVGETNELTNRSHLAGRILTSYGRMLHRQGRVEEAYALYARAMQCEHPGREERLSFANMYLGQGRLEEAERLLRDIVRDHPNFAGAISNLASALATRAQEVPERSKPLLDEAEQLVRRAVAQAPRQPEFLNTLGVVLRAQGRPGEAIPVLESALSSRPGYANARINLVMARLDLRQPQAALMALEPLRLQAPNDPKVQQLLAIARSMLAAPDSGR